MRTMPRDMASASRIDRASFSSLPRPARALFRQQTVSRLMASMPRQHLTDSGVVDDPNGDGRAALLGLRGLHGSAQHLKNDCDRPAKQQYAIHCCERPKQSPAFNWGHIAVSKGRVVNKGEI